MMDQAKLVAIAQIAEKIPREDMAEHRTCALGRSVDAGILTAELFDYGPITSDAAAKQLGIPGCVAQNIFIMCCNHQEPGRECSRRIMAYVLAMG